MNFDVLKRGIQLFNEGFYFESHEELEKIWLNIKGSSEGNFIQGIIKIAAAFHHYKKKNYRGAERLLDSGIKLLKFSQKADIPIDKNNFIESVEIFFNKLRLSQRISEKDFPKINSRYFKKEVNYEI